MSQRNLFEKAFYRRQKNTYTPAIAGAIELVELVFDHADDDMAVATIERAINVDAGTYLLDAFVTLPEEFVGSGTYTLNLGDEGDDDGYFVGVDVENSGSELDANDTIGLLNGTITGVTGAYVEADRITNNYYAASETITAQLVVGTGVPSAGQVRILLLLAMPTTRVIE